jgi:tetratricopeptide (TPR) repeat protein
MAQISPPVSTSDLAFALDHIPWPPPEPLLFVRSDTTVRLGVSGYGSDTVLSAKLYAARFLRWLSSFLGGKHAFSYELQDVYPEWCRRIGWPALSWNSVAKELRLIIGGRKTYEWTFRDGEKRKLRVFIVPAIGEKTAKLCNRLKAEEMLAAATPGNSAKQRDFYIRAVEIGDALMAAGEHEEALTAFRMGLPICKAQVAANPSNAGWQRDLWISFNRVGDALLSAGKHMEGLAELRQARDVAHTLVATDPDNASWQCDLAVSHDRIGNVLVAVGKLEEACIALRKSLGIREVLASNPSNAGWRHRQYELAASHVRFGDALVAAGKCEEALVAFRAGLVIRQALAAADPGNTGWQFDVCVTLWRLADHGIEPQRNFENIVATLTRLEHDDRLTADQKSWIAIARERQQALKQPAK